MSSKMSLNALTSLGDSVHTSVSLGPVSLIPAVVVVVVVEPSKCTLNPKPIQSVGARVTVPSVLRGSRAFGLTGFLAEAGRTQKKKNYNPKPKDYTKISKPRADNSQNLNPKHTQKSFQTFHRVAAPDAAYMLHLGGSEAGLAGGDNTFAYASNQFSIHFRTNHIHACMRTSARTSMTHQKRAVRETNTHIERERDRERARRMLISPLKHMQIPSVRRRSEGKVQGLLCVMPDRRRANVSARLPRVAPRLRSHGRLCLSSCALSRADPRSACAVIKGATQVSIVVPFRMFGSCVMNLVNQHKLPWRL